MTRSGSSGRPQLADQSAGHLVDYARRQAARAWKDGRASVGRSLSEDAIPGYRIVREAFRGGQGIVYDATQVATNRRVAIKVLRDGPLAGPAVAARFEREIHILARLRHPNIVTIHDGGVAGGRCYYVMDFISGRRLSAFVRDAAPTIRESLTLFAKICRAVHAAHLRGVVHRDLKPGNILVDDDGEPRVLDFGLAKTLAVGADGTPRDASVTMTGQFIGSLPWATPEQAAGDADRIDIRSDVYALGLILFHMLTGGFPYAVSGPMRDVLDNILHAEPARPSAHRRDLDADLDTIVLKCLSKEPDRRYQSAGDLALDVQRHLDGRPIEARRDSAWYVASKTLRRHRAVAAGLVVMLVVSVAYAVTVTFLYRRTAASQAREAVQAADAREKYGMARDTVAFLVREVSDRLADMPRARETRRAVLEGAFDRLERLTHEHSDDPALRADLARTHHQLGDIAFTLGRTDQAEAKFETAVDIWSDLLTNDLNNADYQAALSISVVRLGDVARGRGDLPAMFEAYTRAMEIDQGLVRRNPNDVRMLDNLCWSYERLGWVAMQQGDMDLAETYQSKRMKLCERLVALEPDEPLRVYGLGSAYGQLAERAERSCDWSAAEAPCRRAVELGERAIALAPDNSMIRQWLADRYAILSLIVRWLGRPQQESRQYLVRAIRHREQILRLDGNQFDNANHLADLLFDLGRRQTEAHEYAEARRSLSRALELRRQVEQLFPDRSIVSISSGQMLAELGSLAYRQGRADEARAYFEKADESARTALEDVPDDLDRLLFFSGFLCTVEFPDLRRPAEAVALAARAAELAEGRDASVFLMLGRAYLANSEPALARDAFKQGLHLDFPCELADLRDDLSTALASCPAKGGG